LIEKHANKEFQKPQCMASNDYIKRTTWFALEPCWWILHLHLSLNLSTTVATNWVGLWSGLGFQFRTSRG